MIYGPTENHLSVDDSFPIVDHPIVDLRTVDNEYVHTLRRAKAFMTVKRCECTCPIDK